MKDAERIEIYTDGACRGNQIGNPNIGAWSYILLWKDRRKSGAEVVPNTTNNRMEITAVLMALKALKPKARSLPITIYSDSQYVVKGYTEWLAGWRIKDFAGIKNPDLWKELDTFGQLFPNLRFQYVPGHSDVEWNNEADYLCNAAMDVYIREHKEGSVK